MIDIFTLSYKITSTNRTGSIISTLNGKHGKITTNSGTQRTPIGVDNRQIHNINPKKSKTPRIPKSRRQGGIWYSTRAEYNQKWQQLNDTSNNNNNHQNKNYNGYRGRNQSYSNRNNSYNNKSYRGRHRNNNNNNYGNRNTGSNNRGRSYSRGGSSSRGRGTTNNGYRNDNNTQ